MTPQPVVNKTFWQWAGYAAIGVVLWFFLPARARVPACVVLLFGGLVWLQRSGAGGINGLIHTFETAGKE